MATPKTMSGARAKFGIYDPVTGLTRYLGTISSVSYGVTYETQAAAILGRFTVASIQHTAVDVVSISANGWRNFGHGPHIEGGLPRVQDLLLYEGLELLVTDRASEATGVADPRVAKIRNVLPVGFSGGFSAKALSEVSYSFVGILVDDESTTNSEHPTAMAFPA